ncbi:hypothetical protein BBBOND_0206550 [Babesia bigemina]|uniref:Uncharacterized protein n=1 Tax=Babesia bigemina TaxID=5866 RepID=A0A061D654_BABBI|nr:hypothetical protein BBBOND_0206550 [Babesia bigemina]CDR95497.1 hypothetical protein BBBOND_0206550 [Babesia bigemina]|eukprot:XP_012767683.1 hypothetical protein BBBOND_0206550 [Babesia bigemina]
MVYTSLTEVPRNLKEGIDWLLAVKGDDAEKNLKAMSTAIHFFLRSQPTGSTKLPALEKVKYASELFLRRQEFRDKPLVKELLKRFAGTKTKNPTKLAAILENVEECDYKNVVQAFGLTPKNITKKLGRFVGGAEKFLDDLKIPGQYESAYSSEATWDSSCAKDPEACAVVFVGIAPMLYAGLRSLKEEGGPAPVGEAPNEEKRNVADALKAVGYGEGCRGGLSRLDLQKTTNPVDSQALDVIFDLAGFWAFY